MICDSMNRRWNNIKYESKVNSVENCLKIRKYLISDDFKKYKIFMIKYINGQSKGNIEETKYLINN